MRCPALALAILVLAAGCQGATAERTIEVPQAQPGDFATDYIRDDPYPAMLVEVDYVAGYRPSSSALERMRDVFARRLSKPEGVLVTVGTEIPRPARTRWSVGDILALESQHRESTSGGPANPRAAVLWIVYLNGESEFDEGPTRALGMSYDPTSVAIFAQNIERTSVPEVRQVVEAMVLVHEGGHIFGLVNNGLPMLESHEDGAHIRHDRNTDCVMFHQIETQNVERLLSNPAIDFDYNCRLDLYFAGGPDPGPREIGPTPAPQVEGRTAAPVRRPSGPILDTALERR